MEKGIYLFKEEFCKQLKIPMNQPNRRKNELLEWLKNFFDYELLEGIPIRIHVKDILGEYQPLPRKQYDNSQREAIVKAATKDYTEYTIASLGTEFKPNSKSKVARDAIVDFGYNKYSHTNEKWITSNYIKPVFDEYGESDNKKIWVWYSDYTEPNKEVIDRWRLILSEESIDEESAANAFYRHAQGENVDKEIGYFKKARARFKDEYKDSLVLVEKWRCKIPK